MDNVLHKVHHANSHENSPASRHANAEPTTTGATAAGKVFGRAARNKTRIIAFS